MEERVGRAMGVTLTLVAWVVVLGSVTASVWFSRELDRLGRSDLGSFSAASCVLVLGIGSALVVGSALAWRRPEHPVGWLFLALSVSIATAGTIDGYAALGAVADPGRLPAADVAAQVGDATWIPWFVLVALVLHLTPTGRPLSSRWARAAWVTCGAGVVAFVCTLLSTAPVDPPFEDVANPMAIDSVAPVVDLGRAVGATLVGLGLLVAAASLGVRFRRSGGDDRLRLRWLALAVAPLVLFVPAAFVASATHHPSVLLLVTGGFVVVVPVATGLSITRFHLYDVDRILSRSLTYALLTTVIVVTYVAVVLVSSQVLSGRAGGSEISVVIATLVVITIASPVRRFIQDRLDRRFNRRRFDAMRVVRNALAGPTASLDVEALLREAVADPGLAIAYWVEDRSLWVRADGASVAPANDGVTVDRDGVPVACIAFDHDRVDPSVVDATASLARSELDNTRLRAAVALQLVEVNESRARIAAAHLVERRKIERNLHDGAQQRLLGLAFDLQAAQVNGDPERLREAVNRGVLQAHEAVLELRSLANGLCPAVLSDSGLSGALDDLRTRTPVPLVVRCPETRFDPAIEETAWFVLLEAITNALKHGDPSVILVTVSDRSEQLDLTIDDDGEGGADPRGTGLEGLRDRVEAAGGDLSVSDRPEGGTRVEGWLPCAPS